MLQVPSSLVVFLASHPAARPNVLIWQWQACSALPCISSILHKLGQRVCHSCTWKQTLAISPRPISPPGPLQFHFKWQLKTLVTEENQGSTVQIICSSCLKQNHILFCWSSKDMVSWRELHYGGIHSYQGTAVHGLSMYWTQPAPAHFWHCLLDWKASVWF